MKREAFYVGASRGKERLIVITGDKEFLAESISRSGARQSASELARSMAEQRTRDENEQAGTEQWQSLAHRYPRDERVSKIATRERTAALERSPG
jgi:hypothetical protein